MNIDHQEMLAEQRAPGIQEPGGMRIDELLTWYSKQSQRFRRKHILRILELSNALAHTGRDPLHISLGPTTRR